MGETMKKIKLSITNPEGKVVEESQIEISENDTLIVQFKEMKYLTAENLKAITESLKDDFARVLVLPPFITLKVLKRGE